MAPFFNGRMVLKYSENTPSGRITLVISRACVLFSEKNILITKSKRMILGIQNKGLDRKFSLKLVALKLRIKLRKKPITAMEIRNFEQIRPIKRRLDNR